MDGESFDRLSVIVHRLRNKTTRRRALGVLLSGAVAAVSGKLADDAGARDRNRTTNCRRLGRPCSSNRDCCSAECRHGRCWTGVVAVVVVVARTGAAGRRVNRGGIAVVPGASRCACRATTRSAAATRVSPTGSTAAVALAAPAPAGLIAARASSVSAASRGGSSAVAASTRASASRRIGAATI